MSGQILIMSSPFNVTVFQALIFLLLNLNGVLIMVKLHIFEIHALNNYFTNCKALLEKTLNVIQYLKSIKILQLRFGIYFVF